MITKRIIQRVDDLLDQIWSDGVNSFVPTPVCCLESHRWLLVHGNHSDTCNMWSSSLLALWFIGSISLSWVSTISCITQVIHTLHSPALSLFPVIIVSLGILCHFSCVLLYLVIQASAPRLYRVASLNLSIVVDVVAVVTVRYCC